MNAIAVRKQSKNSDPRCADLMALAERELSAFFKAVQQLFGSEQAERSAEDWLQELSEVDSLPATVRELRLITAKASTRLTIRVGAPSLSTEPQAV